MGVWRGHASEALRRIRASGSDASYVHLVTVGYPGASRSVSYNCESAASGRLDNMADDSSGTHKYARYTYLGSGTIVQVSHPAYAKRSLL
jgi:hypothetical protein